jgi:hypothetical protein
MPRSTAVRIRRSSPACRLAAIAKTHGHAALSNGRHFQIVVSELPLCISVLLRRSTSITSKADDPDHSRHDGKHRVSPERIASGARPRANAPQVVHRQGIPLRTAPAHRRVPYGTACPESIRSRAARRSLGTRMARCAADHTRYHATSIRELAWSHNASRYTLKVLYGSLWHAANSDLNGGVEWPARSVGPCRRVSLRYPR